jgi:hypothetical protein
MSAAAGIQFLALDPRFRGDERMWGLSVHHSE